MGIRMKRCTHGRCTLFAHSLHGICIKLYSSEFHSVLGRVGQPIENQSITCANIQYARWIQGGY